MAFDWPFRLNVLAHCSIYARKYKYSFCASSEVARELYLGWLILYNYIWGG